MLIIGGFGKGGLRCRSAKAYLQSMVKNEIGFSPMQSIFSDMGKAIKSNALLLLVFSAILAAIPLLSPGISHSAGGNLFASTLLI